jgi:hypothetical protein
MTQWHRLKSAAGWGLFLGICDWVLASGMVRKLPREAVWAIIASQVIVGLLAGLERWKAAWWAKGAVFGLAVNVPLAAGLRWLLPEWGGPLFVPLMACGLAIGLFIEWVMRRKA